MRKRESKCKYYSLAKYFDFSDPQQILKSQANEENPESMHFLSDRSKSDRLFDGERTHRLRHLPFDLKFINSGLQSCRVPRTRFLKLGTPTRFEFATPLPPSTEIASLRSQRQQSLNVTNFGLDSALFYLYNSIFYLTNN